MSVAPQSSPQIGRHKRTFSFRPFQFVHIDWPGASREDVSNGSRQSPEATGSTRLSFTFFNQRIRCTPLRLGVAFGIVLVAVIIIAGGVLAGVLIRKHANNSINTFNTTTVGPPGSTVKPTESYPSGTVTGSSFQLVRLPPTVFVNNTLSLHPENCTVDSADQTFLLYDGQHIVRIHLNATVEVLSTDLRLNDCAICDVYWIASPDSNTAGNDTIHCCSGCGVGEGGAGAEFCSVRGTRYEDMARVATYGVSGNTSLSLVTSDSVSTVQFHRVTVGEGVFEGPAHPSQMEHVKYTSAVADSNASDVTWRATLSHNGTLVISRISNESFSFDGFPSDLVHFDSHMSTDRLYVSLLTESSFSIVSILGDKISVIRDYNFIYPGRVTSSFWIDDRLFVWFLQPSENAVNFAEFSIAW